MVAWAGGGNGGGEGRKTYSRGPHHLAPGTGPVSLPPSHKRTHAMALNCGRGLTPTGQPRLNTIIYLYTHTQRAEECPSKIHGQQEPQM